MITCIKCNEANFVVKNLRFDPKIKNQTVEVIVPCNVCPGCNGTYMDNDQMNIFRRLAADRYREKNGLLTSKEIIAYREKLGLSQIGFARFLRVGEASVKRWETYYIQDESQDDHIRVKCDLCYSEFNYFYLQCKKEDVDIYSGLRPFSSDSIRQVSQYFEKADSNAKEHLKNLLFYTDFLHFKRHNRCVTGLRYTPLKLGPAPLYYNQLAHFVNLNEFETPKTAYFDDDEKRTLDDVSALFVRDQGQTLIQISGRERGFLETRDAELISYKYAKDLLI